MPSKSIVLPGYSIFNIFFNGTTGDDINLKGEFGEEYGIRKDWNMLQSYFDEALYDISQIANNKSKTQLETWYEIIKKVM